MQRGAGNIPGLRPYRELLRLHGAARLVVLSLTARLTTAVVGLPLLVAARDATGSYAGAGAVLAAFGAGIAVGSPLRGRWLDRRGTSRALPPLLVVHAAGLVGSAVAAQGSSGRGMLVAAAVAGAAAPSLPAAMRLEWQRLLGRADERLPRAYAFEAAAQVTLFVVGPAVAGGGIAVVGAEAVLVAAAVAVLAAGLGFSAAAGARPAPAAGASRSWLGPIRSRGVRTLVVATALADASLGALEVGVVALADAAGSTAAAGPLLGLFAAGSAVGALGYGARTWRGPPARRLVALMLAGAALVACLLVAGSLPVLAPLLLVAGLPFAAQWATSTTALDTVTPTGADAEAYNWLSSANSAGVALGNLAGGAAVHAGRPDDAVLVAVACLLLAAGWTAARVRTL